MLFFLIHVHLGSTLRVCRPPPLSFFRNPPALHSHGKQPAVDEKLTSALRRQPSAFKTGDKLGPSLPPSAYRDIPPDRRPSAGQCSSRCFLHRSGSNWGWPPTSGRSRRRRRVLPSMCRTGGYNVDAVFRQLSFQERTGNGQGNDVGPRGVNIRFYQLVKGGAPAGEGRLLVIARSRVFRSSVAPTVRMTGSIPGVLIVKGAGPSFPAAAQTTNPLCHADSFPPPSASNPFTPTRLAS